MELRAHRAARLLALALAALALALAALPAAATADDEPRLPPSQAEPPPYHRLTATQAVELADGAAEVREARRRGAKLAPTAYTKGASRWQVSYFERGRERVQVILDDGTGRIVEAWTGPQVAWKMARGYEGAFGGKLNAPYVWLPLCALFLLPFVDPRRPFRLLHLDLLALLAFGASHVFFNRADIDTSVPLVYPVLAYLLVRMLIAGFRPRERRERLVPLVPAVWLAFGIVFLLGFRVALNVADSSVIDVGYAGVIGADRIVDGDGLYDGDFPKDNEHGDTYGPVNYLAYVPFEQAMPWSGSWDELPAARGASIAFDLLTMIGLWLLGRRIRPGPEGRDLGVALAYGWAAYPYTTYVLASNANDTLVAMLLVLALLLVASPAGRGAALALAGAAKFAALPLAPLFATASADGGRRVRSALVASLAFLAVLVAVFAPFVPDGGLRELYDRTVGYQAGRDSPFSIWGQEAGLGWLWTVVKGAVVALAVAVAFVPRRKTPVQVAALGAAVLILLQAAVSHWFYLYVVWFAPFVLLAIFAPYRGAPADSPPPAAEPERAEREPEPALA